MSSSINLRRLQEREARLRIELNQCEVLLNRIIDAGQENKAAAAWDYYEELTGYLARSTVIEAESKSSLIFEAKRHAFLAHRARIQDLLEKALDFARAGDPMKKIVQLKLATQCLDQMGKLTDDSDFLREVQKRIDVARETTKPGESERAKLFVADREYRGLGNEKRRFLRYAVPALIVRFGKDTSEFRTRDFSLTGMLIEGLPPDLREGTKIQIAVRVDGDTRSLLYSGTTTVARILGQAGPVGLQFSTADGPTLFFIRERVFDLNFLDPL